MSAGMEDTMGESRKTVEFMSSLEERSYKKVAYWNLFCRKMILPVLLTIMYAYGAFSLVHALKIGNTYGMSQFVVSISFALLGLIMPTIVLIMNEKRMRKEMKSHNIPEDTRKFIRMAGDEISLLRMKINEMLEYKWNDVEGVYPFPERVIFSMKDKQIFMADSDRISEEDRAYLLKRAEETHVLKKAVRIHTVILAGGVITAAAAVLGWLL